MLRLENQLFLWFSMVMSCSFHSFSTQTARDHLGRKKPSRIISTWDHYPFSPPYGCRSTSEKYEVTPCMAGKSSLCGDFLSTNDYHMIPYRHLISFSLVLIFPYSPIETKTFFPQCSPTHISWLCGDFFALPSCNSTCLLKMSIYSGFTHYPLNMVFFL